MDIPKSSQKCQLSVINAGCDFCLPLNYLVEPDIPGYKWLNLPTFCFHLKHGNGTELLFDLGCRPDWDKSAPHVAKLLPAALPGLNVTGNAIDILAEGGVDFKNVKAFILSHYHFDHCGKLEQLPKHVKVVTGPEFSKNFLPGYPKNEDSPFNEADFEGRELHEIAFSNKFKIGDFQAHDYFGDGSLYILNTPGHTPAHISALVRTTPDTFVFLGGDICHHAADFRPTERVPLPDEIPKGTAMDKKIPLPCPCTAFLSAHPDGENGRTKPFLRIAGGATSFYTDPKVARESAKSLEEYDADPNILVAIAHDPTYLDVFDFFPKHTMNDWQKKGWKKATHWGFLSEFPYNGKTVREPMVDGFYLMGKRLRGYDLPKAGS